MTQRNFILRLRDAGDGETTYLRLRKLLKAAKRIYDYEAQDISPDYPVGDAAAAAKGLPAAPAAGEGKPAAPAPAADVRVSRGDARP